MIIAGLRLVFSIPLLLCRSRNADMPFSNSVAIKKVRKKIPFRSSREQQKSAVAVRPLKYDRLLFFPLFRNCSANYSEADESCIEILTKLITRIIIYVAEYTKNGGLQCKLACFR